MINLQFPTPHFNIKIRAGKRYVFDEIRKTWLLLTEEEWVRQNMVAFLLTVMAYPKTMLTLEKGLLVNGLRKRFDMLIYDEAHQPWMLIECKAPLVDLDESVLQQALRYNMTVPVKWIVITNGEKTLAWQKGEKD